MLQRHYLIYRSPPLPIRSNSHLSLRQVLFVIVAQMVTEVAIAGKDYSIIPSSRPAVGTTAFAVVAVIGLRPREVNHSKCVDRGPRSAERPCCSLDASKRMRFPQC